MSEEKVEQRASYAPHHTVLLLLIPLIGMVDSIISLPPTTTPASGVSNADLALPFAIGAITTTSHLMSLQSVELY